jgi:hypothetical protein
MQTAVVPLIVAVGRALIVMDVLAVTWAQPPEAAMVLVTV